MSIEEAAKARGYSYRSIHRIVKELKIPTKEFHGAHSFKFFLKREDVERIPMNPKRST